MGHRALVNRLLFMFASLCCAVAANAIDAPVDHQLGKQYSPLQQINTGNVAKLTKAWEFHTGDDPNEVKGLVAMEDQPSLIEGNLVVCSTDRVMGAQSRSSVGHCPNTFIARVIFIPIPW